ncbi:Fur family transcriptional regulator [Arenibaculum sp.]|jgi:Fur family zinc uptake transcriptional regulator|uniref:Fur family transcriptional regulator n=1 Tax=Arenibaculum sp. TaxID=2865862 RepID=UPI002E1540B5|nr:Fur family transcriptional regulator [Arenibaculum sp.]
MSASHAHDHSRCINDALAAADAVCAERGVRLTEIRRRVLELVWQSHRPVGAYDLLDRLASEGRRAAPPTVYRALDFLMEHGLVHRIHSLNAFVGCAWAGEGHSANFMICSGCGEAVEFDGTGLTEAIGRIGAGHGFRVRSQVVEVIGRCAGCAGEAGHG